MNESQLQNLSDKEFCEYVEPDSVIAREAINRLSVASDVDQDQIDSLEVALSDSEHQVDGLESELELAKENLEWIKSTLNEAANEKQGFNANKKISEIIDELKLMGV